MGLFGFHWVFYLAMLFVLLCSVCVISSLCSFTFPQPHYWCPPLKKHLLLKSLNHSLLWMWGKGKLEEVYWSRFPFLMYRLANLEVSPECDRTSWSTTLCAFHQAIVICRHFPPKGDSLPRDHIPSIHYLGGWRRQFSIISRKNRPHLCYRQKG